MTQAIGKVGSKLLLDMHFVPGLQCLPVNCDTHHPMHTLSLAPGSQAVWVLLLFSCEALIYASKYTTFVYESKALYPWSPHYRFCVCMLLCAGEMDIYQANSEALVMMAGADVGLPQQATYNGIPVEEWPRVVLSPSFAPCLDAIKVRPPGSGWEGGGWGWGPGGRAGYRRQRKHGWGCEGRRVGRALWCAPCLDASKVRWGFWLGLPGIRSMDG
jgi:hypothetical protein